MPITHAADHLQTAHCLPMDKHRYCQPVRTVRDFALLIEDRDSSKSFFLSTSFPRALTLFCTGHTAWQQSFPLITQWWASFFSSMTKESVSVIFVNPKWVLELIEVSRRERVDRKDFKIIYWISTEGHLHSILYSVVEVEHGKRIYGTQNWAKQQEHEVALSLKIRLIGQLYE